MEYKRTIDEAITLHEFEPKLKTLYLEGRKDEGIVTWFLEKKRKLDIDVYSVNEIEIPEEVILKHNLNLHSNRSKLIALAKELDSKIKTKQLKLLCVIDRDFDDYLEKDYSGIYLGYTDYNSMEMYCFNKTVICKFIKIVLGGLALPVEELIRIMTNVLKDIFSIRLTNERLQWGMRWLDFDNLLSVKNKKVTLDTDEFIRRYLMANSKIKSILIFQGELENVKEMLDGDDRKNIKGHDFPYLLFHIIRRKKKIGFSKYNNTFNGALFGCLEVSDIENEKLFRKILGF